MPTITDKVVDLAKDYGASEDASAQTISEALDLLNDTLAGSDQAGAGTISDALGALSGNIVPSGTLTITENGEGIDVAQYAAVDVAVSGGASVGALVPVMLASDGAPSVGDAVSDWPFAFVLMSIGDDPLYEDGSRTDVAGIASGITVTTQWDSELVAVHAYVVTIDDDKYATIEAWDGTITMEEDASIFAKRYTFTMPALNDGETLLIWEELG